MKIIITLDVKQADPSKPLSDDANIIDTVEYFSADNNKLSNALFDIHNLNITMVGADIVK